MTNAVPMPQLIGGTRRTSWSSFPFVYEDENLSSLHFEIDSVQSLMDKAAPNQLMLRYTQFMMGFLLFNDYPEHIGMIGLGGGSLPKYCYQHLPRTRISVAEISPEVMALRDYFLVPRDNERFKVLLEDGAEFVKGHSASLDVLMVDGFDLTGQPPQLCSESFYQDCHRALTRNGIVVVNLCDVDYKASLRKIREVFEDVLLCDCPDGTNRIVFARKSGKLSRTPQRLVERSKELRSLYSVDLDDVADQLLTAQDSTCRQQSSLNGWKNQNDTRFRAEEYA
jgi:spermidine synthase